MAEAGQVPQIVTFQMDATAVGRVRSSVNLFRGDVTFSQPLFRLPGRDSDPGLAVAVSLLYQSNVTRDATTWNRDAPTGAVGLGWLLPRTCITREDGGAPTPGAWSYAYVSNGVTTPLIPEPATPFLFGLEASLAAVLQDGRPVPGPIASAFAARGVALGADTAVAQDAGGAWTLTDAENQRLFTLVAQPGALRAFDGGQSFQLGNYAFWKILYYAAFERWVIVDESGRVHSFGGLAAPVGGCATSIGNSIEWAVRWTSSSGAALWRGPSTETAGQQQYARAWNLVATTNIWGDGVRYGYNEWPRDAETGLIHNVEQRVGAGGLPYTKACYLTSATDVFGRTARFAYAGKLWDDSAPEAPREYADPHKAVPDTTPNAYQDRYETLFLSGVTVAAPGGATLFSIAFTYAPRPEVAGPAGAVANVTTYTGSLQGDTYKRFLTGITQANAAGETLPGLLFDYWLDPAAAGASPGALAAITYPQGAVASYSYTRQSLPVCDRTQRVDPPAGIAAGGTPQVWFGPDYAVTTWLGPGGGPLSLVVYTWVGRWIAWQAGPSAVLYSGSDAQAATMNVIAQQDSFALTFQQGPETAVAYVFRRSIGRPGQWVPAAIPGRPQTGPDSPTLSYATPGGGGFFAGGASFLLGGVMDDSGGPCAYDRLTWRWTEAAWTLESFTTDLLYLTARNEYYVTLDAASGTLSLFRLDPALAWQAAGSCTLPDYVQPGTANLAITPDDALVVVSVVQNPQADPMDHTLFLVRWDGEYALQVPVAFSYSDRQGATRGSWVGAPVGAGLVACGPRLLRFTGTRWLANDALYQPDPRAGVAQRYAYGPDYALLIAAGPQAQASASVLVFDPDADCAVWTRAPVTPAQALPGNAPVGATANWPAAAGVDHMVIGQYLYSRGASTDWSDVLQAPPLGDMQALVNQALGSGEDFFLDTQSLVAEPPGFLAAYAYSASGRPAQTAAFLPRNGALAGPDGAIPGLPAMFADELIWTLGTAGGAPAAGASPGGPDSFAAYPAGAPDFAQAPYFYLHRYAGGAVDGALVHYAVTGLSVQDGLGGVQPTAFLPDTSDAACDPTGRVVKYYRSTTCPGTSDPSQPVCGSAVSRYINGQRIESGLDYYDMLDGLPYGVETYDAEGKLLSSSSHGWQVFVQRATDPGDAAAPVANLYGGFVCRIARSRTLDGVTSSRVLGYCPPGLAAPYSGLPVSTTVTTWGGTGAAESFITTTLYGYDVSPLFAPLNLLTAQAQTTTTWSRAGAAAVPVKASATAYTAWTNAAGASVPGAEADFSWTGAAAAGFPFAAYQPGTVPPGWLRTGRTVARTPLGLVIETEDAGGVPHSTLYAGQDHPVARFANASLTAGACAYAGFEPYEDQTTFAAAGGASVQAGDAHSGSCSLALVPGGTLAASLTPPNATQTYLLGYWCKTPAGFDPAPGTGWQVELRVDGGAPTRLSSPFADTGGQWAYATMPIPLTAGSASIALAITAANTGTATVLLDDVFVAPLVSRTAMHAYDPRLGLLTCSTTASGRTTRRHHDRFGRLAAAVGPAEQAKEITQRFLSRVGAPGGAFLAASPNAEVTLHPADGGTLEGFLSGDEWTARWSASNLGTNWRCLGGALLHTAAAADTLTWAGWGGATPPPTAALFFELVPSVPLAGPVSVTFGAGCVLAYDGTGYSLTDPGGGTVQAPLGAPPGPAAQWLLVLGAGTVLFLADGQLVFSAALACGGTGAIAIGTGPNPLALRNLAVLGSPRLGLSHLDGAGRTVQLQQLAARPDGSGSDSRVLQHISDGLGRRVATTRAAPGLFGSGASRPLMAYRPGFADAQAFLAAMADSWRLTGDVADYYGGQTDGPVPRSDDQGYPYYGTRYAAVPLSRPLEHGLPGLALAIHDVQGTTPAQRATTQLACAANPGGGDPDLPAGDYFLRTVTNPVKTATATQTDSARRRVTTALLDEAGTAQAMTAAAIGFDSDGTAAETVQLPNALTPGPQGDDDAYVATVLQDPLGRVVARTDPDTGTTLALHDPAGRLRFQQPALDAGETGFLYWRYDALGRVVEEGLVPQPWDAATLAPLAADPSWPGEDVPRRVARSHAYDGDGSLPSAIGRKVAVVTANPDPAGGAACVVTESFAYDGGGRVAEVTLALAGPANATACIGYGYNALNEVISIRYPEGATLAEVFYARDDQGRIAGIGASAATPTDIAAYTYTPDGDVETETRNGGTLVTTFQYASPGWLLRQAVQAAGAAAPCIAIATTCDDAGRPATRGITLAFPGGPSQETALAFTRDPQGRLLSATVAGGGPGSEAITEYDPNGNIWGATLDGASWTFACAPGSDLLAGGTAPDGTALAFAYGADGWLTTNRDLTLAHDPVLGLTSAVTVAGEAGQCCLRLAYGGAGARVLKQATGAASSLRVTACGAGRTPLAWLEDGAWTVAVPGPGGRLAAVAAEGRCFPVEDAQGTLWAVLDAANAPLACHAYSAFGTPLAAPGPSGGPLGPRFLGKALDAESGLYDFGARLYDPALRRFCSPDAARQYPSPYVFAGNDPLSLLDPSGNLSLWARIGIGAAMVGVTLLGVGLTIVTGGVSDELAAAADVALAGGLEAGMEMSDLGGEAALEGVEAEGEMAGEEAEAGGEAESQAGSRVAQERAASLRIASRAISVAGQAGGNALTSGGQAGLQYDIQNGRSFTAQGFFEAFGAAAAAGLVTGAASGALGVATGSWSATAKYFLNLPVQPLLGAGSGAFGQFLTNAMQHAPLDQGVLQAAAGGALQSFAQTAIPTAVPDKVGRFALPGGAKLASTALLNTVGAAAYNAEPFAQIAIQNAISGARGRAARAALLTTSAALLDTVGAVGAVGAVGPEA